MGKINMFPLNQQSIGNDSIWIKKKVLTSFKDSINYCVNKNS